MGLLESAKFKLRALEPDDLEFVYNCENETQLWQYGDNLAPMSRLQLADYINNYDADIFKAQQLRLIAIEKQTKQRVGIIDFYDLDIRNNRTAIGIVVSTKYRQQGYGYDLLSIAVEYAFQHLGLIQIVAYINPENAASINLFSKVEFEESGYLKKWHHVGNRYQDIVIMQLFNKEIT